MVKRYVFQSPDNLNISIVAIQEGFAQPAGPGMLNMPQQDYFNPEKYINKTCGMFGEFAHPVKELGESISFWQKIGFSVLSKFSSPYPWAIVSDGLHVAGLHETNNFAYSALTFFAADMQNKIDLLKGKGLDNFTEQGSSNVVLLTPEKQHINLFKLGM